jgi:hypothetical protein
MRVNEGACGAVQRATSEEVADQMRKMTTKNDGTSIRLKLGNGQSIIIK